METLSSRRRLYPFLEVNEELSNDPSLINSDPYGAGWLYKIRLDVPTETEDMMNATDYEEYCS